MSLPSKRKFYVYICIGETYHKVREQAGEHCTLFCRKYAKGLTVPEGLVNPDQICEVCLKKSAPLGKRADKAPLALIQARGHHMSDVSKQTVRKGFSL